MTAVHKLVVIFPIADASKLFKMKAEPVIAANPQRQNSGEQPQAENIIVHPPYMKAN